MTTNNGLDERRQQMFDALVALISQWRANGQKTTTAGVTSALLQSGALNLERAGLASNADFWAAAETAGAIQRERLDTGHVLVLLPGEDAESAVAATRSARAVVPAGMRLRPDLWSAFVDWNTTYRRFWDREYGRAFFVPVAEGWIPEDTTDRFVEISPALLDAQLKWMKTFAAAKPAPQRSQLLEALQGDAPRGAFSKELLATGLQTEWRSTLRREITEMAMAWADGAGIAHSSILERSRRTVNAPKLSAPVVTTVDTAAAKPAASSRTSPVVDPMSELRSRVHRAVDLMSLEDLLNIPLRGEHLLGF